MIVKSIDSDEVLYDTGGDEFEVTDEFWDALEAGKIRFRSTDEPKPGAFVTYIRVLDIDDDDFEEKFSGIANSTVGKLVMKGDSPVSEIL